jgi:hypothetical protein
MDQGLHGYNKVNAEPEDGPNITVRPTSIDFSALNADGESATETITIGNNGNETLNIHSISLGSDGGVFTITSLETDAIEPGESGTVEVTYDPRTYEENAGTIMVYSDDPDEGEVPVSIIGSGDAPVIWLDPDDYDFGTTLVGCDITQEIYIWNAGNVDLVVDQVDYYITFPADLGIYDYETLNGPLPWTIAPGEFAILEIYHNPMDLEADAGDIEVHSNDPFTPVANAIQTAVGSYESMYEETFDQDEVSEVDILFVIDNSGSMSGNHTQLSNNFETFMNVFIASGIDYHIGFVTTDDSTMQGGLIDTSTVDPVGDVQTIISDIGTRGSATEKGIEHAYEALQTSADFGPGSAFWRTDSKLIIIFVSDEDDSSLSVSPSTLQTYVVAVKGGADYVTAHAVAGDYPGGCATNGGAAEGYDYWTAVNLLHGTFLSICADDWGTPLETLANESLLKNSFSLAKQAVEDTIYVEVDGVESAEWTYDSTTNAISFNEGYTPTAGSNIYVSYNPVSECP